MNREIKFRAWDGKKMNNNIGIHPFIMCNHSMLPKDDSNYIEEGDGSKTFLTCYDKLMQYTGLKDKNGKEIYEGDICKSSDCRIGVIKWDTDSLSFFRFVDDGTDTVNYCSFQDFKVIGNIYENPELLK